MSIKRTFKKSKLANASYMHFKRILTTFSPTLNTKIAYRLSKGKPINLIEPKTLDEKISWLKLNTYYKNPLVSQCADKYAVREYIRKCGYEEILNDLYGVYEKVEEIPWSELPNRFVLKWNMGCGCNIICHNKKDLDIKEAKKKLRIWGRTKYHLPKSEMQYKYIEPKIVCEKFLGGENGAAPEDYKFYCFNGVAKYVMVCVGRDKGHPRFYFFDRDWNLARINRDSKAAPDDFSIKKPEHMNEMFLYADRLSKPFPFVRTDFYYVRDRIIFGELTFTPAGGMDSSRLPETDLMLGNMLKLHY